MKLENYISDLLYRYECVIVPDFGGFVTTNTGSRIDYNKHHFYPPYKKLSFNSYLKNNDGLLVNHIASVERISYDEATVWIQQSLQIWQENITNGAFSLAKLGTFELNKEGKLQFEPNLVENYLTSSFGLSSPVVSEAISREVLNVVKKPAVFTISKPETVKTLPKEQKSTALVRTLPLIAKYAAAAVIAVSLFGVGNNFYQQKLQEEFVIAAQQNQLQTEHKIQEATFVISNPLPAITINVEKESKNFHIIAGAFRSVENAENKVAQLKKLGYNSHIVDVNKWSLTEVAFDSYTTMDEATHELTQILNKVDENAWILVTNN